MKKKRLKFNFKKPEAEPAKEEAIIVTSEIIEPPVLMPEPMPQPAPEQIKKERLFKGHGYVINPYGTLIFFDSRKGYVFKTRDERIAIHLKKIGYKEVC